VALERVHREEGEVWNCRVYSERPVSCRDFELGSENCVEARARVGIKTPAEPIV
jgi:Fe-S-cluster containining protein